MTFSHLVSLPLSFPPSLSPPLPLPLYLQVILTFVCVLTKESVEITPVPYTLQVPQVALNGRDPSNPLRREKKQVQCLLGQYRHPRGTHCCMRCPAGTKNKYSNSDLHLKRHFPVLLSETVSVLQLPQCSLSLVSIPTQINS